MLTVLLLALCAFFHAPTPAAAQTAFGPLVSEEVSPLQRVGFVHTVEGADLVPARTV